MKRIFICNGKDIEIKLIKTKKKHSQNYINLRKKKRKLDEKYKNLADNNNHSS